MTERARPSGRTRSRSREITSVGLTGFEPAASSSRTRRATKLRHSPIALAEVRREQRQPYPSATAAPKSARAAQSRAVSVSSVASGRQATAGAGRTGLVPRPAETCSQDEPGSPGRESAGCRCRPLARARLEVAVGGRARRRPAGRPGRRGCARPGPRRTRRRRTGRAPAGTARARRRAARRRRRVGRAGDVVEPVVVRGAGRRRRRRRRSVPPTVERVRGCWSGPASRPSTNAARSSRHGSSGVSVCALAVVGQQVAQRVAQRRREVVVGAEHEHAGHVEQAAERVEHDRARSRGGARLSPVSTTRSGSRSARPRTHACLARWPGVRCRSLRCSTRSGRCPAGSSGGRPRAGRRRGPRAAAYAGQPPRPPRHRRRAPEHAARQARGGARGKAATMAA